LLIGRDV